MTDDLCPVCDRPADVTRGGSPISSVWCHLDAGGFGEDPSPHITCDYHGLLLAPAGSCGGCDDVRWSTEETEEA